jgi:hypothetical protein
MIPVKQIAGAAKDIHMSINVLQQAADSWTRAARFIFPGSNVLGTPAAIKVVAGHDSTSGDLRVYDVTNSQVICSLSSFGSATGIKDLGAISNVPAGEAEWELQYQETGSGNVDVHSIWIAF